MQKQVHLSQLIGKQQHTLTPILTLSVLFYHFWLKLFLEFFTLLEWYETW